MRHPDDPDERARTCEDWAMRGVYAVPKELMKTLEKQQAKLKRMADGKSSQAPSKRQAVAEEVADSPAKVADPTVAIENDREQARHPLHQIPSASAPDSTSGVRPNTNQTLDFIGTVSLA